MSIINCPECGGSTFLDDRITLWQSDMIHVRVCNPCGIQFEVRYTNPVRENVQRLEKNDE